MMHIVCIISNMAMLPTESWLFFCQFDENVVRFDLFFQETSNSDQYHEPIGIVAPFR